MARGRDGCVMAGSWANGRTSASGQPTKSQQRGPIGLQGRDYVFGLTDEVIQAELNSQGSLAHSSVSQNHNANTQLAIHHQTPYQQPLSPNNINLILTRPPARSRRPLWRGALAVCALAEADRRAGEGRDGGWRSPGGACTYDHLSIRSDAALSVRCSKLDCCAG